MASTMDAEELGELEIPGIRLSANTRVPKTSQSIRDSKKIQRRLENNGLLINQVTLSLAKYFNGNMTSKVLMSFAKYVTEKYNFQLDRLAKRRRSALFCWYTENWDLIHSLLRSKTFMKKFYKSQTDIGESQNKNKVQKIEQIKRPFDPSDLSLLLNH